MPRPTKCRRVCQFPQTLEFCPAQGAEGKEPVILTVDEYESIRLIDKEDLSQEQCAARMQVSRTTVQQIYANARKKLALALVDSLPIRIQGGDYQLCDGRDPDCGSAFCFPQQFRRQYDKPKGKAITRVAVPYENGGIFQHFGRSLHIKFYDIADGRILFSGIVDTEGHGHCALVGLLNALDVDILLCGGIGPGARAALAAAGIQLYSGLSGNADTAVASLIAGTLSADPVKEA
ncbi:MAG: DUF134 domain-containing protein [Faecousia sp.]